VIVFAVVFGLSMDYEVFLVSRIHEEWRRTADAQASVREGLAMTGGVITGRGGDHGRRVRRVRRQRRPDAAADGPRARRGSPAGRAR
jgi:hypothetical protein